MISKEFEKTDSLLRSLSINEELYSKDASEILEIRARELAKRGNIIADDEDCLEILEFLLSGERYAISMSYVKEVALMRSITTLPGTPPFVLGIINLRGTVISIVDLRNILGLPPKGLTDYNRVIVLYSDTMSFGILADAIIMTRKINMNAISRPPPTVSGIGAAYLIGVLLGPLMVIDAKAMLSDPRMVIGDE